MLHLRVLLLFCLGYYCSAVAATLLIQFGIDLFVFFGESGQPKATVAHIVQKANLLLAVVLGGMVTSFAVSTVFDLGDTIPWLTVALFGYLVLENRTFRRILARVCRGGISTEFRIGDVLISDCMVSYASVFTDLALSLSLSISGSELDRSAPHPFVLLVASLPIGVRIKQCAHDYYRTGDKQHLFNLLKYFVSNLPNALRIQMLEKPELAAYLPYVLTVSTLYSLYWDLVFDWALFRNRIRHFPSWSYHAVVGFDVVLRFAWLAHKPTEYRIIGLQTLEIIRRTVWVLFRVEHEEVPLLT